MQQLLIYILYAVQGCSHSPTLISNTDNEETATVTMETSEDTEACKVVLVTQWMRGFKLNIIPKSTIQGHYFNTFVNATALIIDTEILDVERTHYTYSHLHWNFAAEIQTV